MTDGEFRRRYKLPGVKRATGPPRKVVPQEYFDRIGEAVTKRRAKRRRRDADDFSFF